MSLTEVVECGNRLEQLIELRNLLAKRLDKSDSDRDIAALSRQFVQVTAEIEELRGAEPSKTVSLTDFRNKLKVV